MKVQELLYRDNWTVDTFARNLEGRPVGLFEFPAVRFDLEGALWRCYGYQMKEWWKPKLLFEVQRLYGREFRTLGQFNDFFDFDTVMSIVRRFDL